MILDKKNIYVEKDDKLVLEGNRNLIDGLWDIPIPYYDIYKKIVQTNNHIQPPTHMAMYMAKEQPATSKPLQKKKKTQCNKYFATHSKRLKISLKPICNYEVDRKIKIDIYKLNTENLTRATITSPSIYIVLRKNETKKDLIKFHHAIILTCTIHFGKGYK